MGIMGTDTITRTPITRFLPFNFEKRQLPVFFLPNFEKITMKKRVFGVHHLFVVKLEKLDNAIGVKIISLLTKLPLKRLPFISLKDYEKKF